MIHGAFLHCRGIGPVRLAKLQQAGIRSWSDVLLRPELVPLTWRESLTTECRICLDALEERNVPFFVERLSAQDRWRILAEFLDETSYFDIETFGLEYDAPITTIVCWHQGKLHTFVEHENLDDFLELLDDITLLASFNGSSFDVPRVLSAFHIPQLPCPHLDLRWLCYHMQLHGGLKEIADRLGITRPADLRFANGEMAVRWWARWIHGGDRAARDQLVRYCAADVLILVLLARRICESAMGNVGSDESSIWNELPPVAEVGYGESAVARRPEPSRHGDASQDSGFASQDGTSFGINDPPLLDVSFPFGTASPSRLRGRRGR